MSGGGMGSGTLAPVAPVYTDPVNGMSFDSSNALNDEIAARVASEKSASDTLTQQGNQTRASNEARFQTDLGNAKTQAQTNAEQYFTDNGYDPKQFATQIANAIATSAGNVYDPNLSTTTASGDTSSLPAIGAAFSPNLGASILSSANEGYRSRASNAISNLFTPTYAADNISDSWIDPAASTLLASQFDPLTSQLTNAFKRGTLNDTGYKAANDALGVAKTKAMSTVSSLGQNILANDRSGIDSYISGAKSDAANVNASTFGSFDPAHYMGGATNLISKNQSNFAGDLSNAVGSTSFADLASLLNAGGAVQGATDPTATNPNGGGAGSGGVSDAYIAQQALANQKRGLGSSGAF